MRKSILFAVLLLCSVAFALIFAGYPYKPVMIASVLLMLLLFSVETYGIRSIRDSCTGDIYFEIIRPPFLLRVLTALALIPFNAAFFAPFVLCTLMVLLVFFAFALSLFCFALLFFSIAFVHLPSLFMGVALTCAGLLLFIGLFRLTAAFVRTVVFYFASNLALFAKGAVKADAAKA